jgi:hypothetical protein
LPVVAPIAKAARRSSAKQSLSIRTRTLVGFGDQSTALLLSMPSQGVLDSCLLHILLSPIPFICFQPQPSPALDCVGAAPMLTTSYHHNILRPMTITMKMNVEDISEVWPAVLSAQPMCPSWPTHLDQVKSHQVFRLLTIV